MGNFLSSVFGWSKSSLEEKREEIFEQDEQKIMHCDEPELSTAGYDRLQENESISDELDSSETKMKLANYKYPFENLIFEGGGNKGLAYCGAIKCLEELNVMPQIKRVGGSSAGAITATLVAMGYSSADIAGFMSQNLRHLFLDHSYGYLSFLPNLIRGWGWNPGHRIYQWFGDKIKVKTASGNPDLTFYELYKEKQIELCVVVTNLNQMRSEYCHPKTTPAMPIREALRMSISIPVVFMARKYDNNGQKDTYVDGGVLCNYPIQCFDGWYLSMDKEDAFLLRMQNLDDLPHMFAVKTRFQNENKNDGLVNKKTVGFLLYDSTEVEIMKSCLEVRKGAVKPDKPDVETELYRKKIRERNIQNIFKQEQKRCQEAAEAFMQALHKHNVHEDVFIDKDELKKAIEDDYVFKVAHRELLFGKNISVDEALSSLDKDDNGKIDYQELMHFLEKKNIRIQMRIQGYNRTNITNLLQFGSALQNAWTTNLKYVYTGESDFHRTVGINTGHVGTSNYVLEDADRKFLIDRGYNATVAFLWYFVGENDMVKNSSLDEEVLSEPGETMEVRQRHRIV